ncbi:MAG: FAD-dependent oxidoreductase [Gammaproteobacteria bacterium]|nr:FAD-dependent oxidoreductase [Gammaproteobacteria bacterium]
MITSPKTLELTDFTFAELFTAEGLKRLDDKFIHKLKTNNLDLFNQLQAYRQQNNLTPIQTSELLLACAPHLEKFLIELFNIEEAAALAQIKTISNNPISIFKKYFVLRRAKKQLLQSANYPSFQELDTWLKTELQKSPLQADDKELAVALLGNHYTNDLETYATEIEKLTQWCVQALETPDGKNAVAGWVSFKIPERLDYANLVPTIPCGAEKIDRKILSDDKLRLRDGFKLTDPRMNAREIQDEVNYCIYCHDHDGDFCSKGFPVKKGDPTQGLKKNPLDVTLTGCPLEEKISEMHLLKRDGHTLAALAMVMVDNPMCPATGHRICNDCMKACIYQKQEPVNIPQIETGVLIDVLHLPWGVEIYDLLTRWNPLRQHQWVMKPYNGLKVLIAGMGPAGFTLAHHLLLEGFAVVGFDGLKIEPLPEHLINAPIHRFADLTEQLDERLMAGFGGVAEYGITVRWDKNFLKLIYISLSRRPYFQVFGSTRFGGTVTVNDAWELGFDHFVVAVGAGLPKALAIPGSLAPGMRQANDFLMALQLGNAANKSSLTNLQVRLPAVIIGGGLTGVDTATEVQAYYIAQVEKILFRYEKLIQVHDEEYVRKNLDIASIEILEEFLTHGRLVRQERERAKEQRAQPNFIKLIKQWGGVTIAYRRSMQDSPAYINNHEELKKALEEGIYYADSLEPAAAELNQHGHVETLVCHKRIRKSQDEWDTTQEEVKLPARAIFVATGTQPNIAYEFEHKGTFARLGFQYEHYEDENGELTVPHGITHCKEEKFGPFTSYKQDDHRVSLIGDTHPVFHGNVVKAIASGLRTYPKIVNILKSKLGKIGRPEEYLQFSTKINELFKAHIVSITRQTHNVFELVIHAPLAAKHFQPGQFFRLQNFETFSPKINHTTMQMEPLALIGADVDKAKGNLKFIVIENGTSAKVCSTLRVSDPVALMGPTGIRHKIAHEHESILIYGNQLSIALLQSYGKALRAAGNRVIFVGDFKNKDEVYCQAELEESADSIIWVTETGDPISVNRPQDYSFTGKSLDALLLYAHGKLDGKKSQPEIPLSDLDGIFLVGNSHFLKSFQEARNTVLKEFLIKNPRVSGSVYSSMQCMLKGVCAQCLQWQIDPETGKRTKAVFACSWPDQPLEIIDFANLDERQVQNKLQEQLSNMWIDYLFEEYAVERV